MPHLPRPPREETAALVRRALMVAVMVDAIALVFLDAPALVWAGAAMLVVVLASGWRQFSVGTWVPVGLSVAMLALALASGVPAGTYLEAADRMVFLAALIAVLGTLRAAAGIAPEVAQAGLFLTGQPASRRYLALSAGGHLFGTLINFGGLALLLDLASRSMSSEATSRLPPEIREVKLKRMTLAIVRGFALISFWSPLGFSANVILITLPSLSYVQFGPLGFAMSFVFLGLGFLLDRVEGRRYRGMGIAAPRPPEGAWRGALLLVGHVALLGGGVIGLHEVTPLSFQKALILVVPAYALLWALVSGLRSPPPRLRAGIPMAAGDAWRRLSATAGEVGVFASAGFLSVILLDLVPVDLLRGAVADIGLGPIAMAIGLSVSIILLALVGVNPIVSSSVTGAVAAQLGVPGLSDLAIALAMIGGWCTVIGLSPFITTIIFTSSIIGRPPVRIGPAWNGLYCALLFGTWSALLAVLMATGTV